MRTVEALYLEERPRPSDVSWRKFGRGVLRFFLFAVLLVGLVPFGATGPFAMPIMGLFAASAALLSLPLGHPGRRTRLLELLAILVGGGLCFYAMLQATGYGAVLAPHPVWAEASAVLGRPLDAVASIAPSLTYSSLSVLLAPFLMFVAGLRACGNDEDALAILRALALIGGGVAFFGVIQFAVAPSSLLLVEKTAYLDSLTAVFVNRNSAATYLGGTALLALALIRHELRGIGLRASLSAIVAPARRVRRNWWLLVYLGVLGFALLALLQTKSRAGLACSGLGILAFVTIVAFRKGRRRAVLGSFGALILGSLALGALVAVFGRQTWYRIEVKGLDDARFCVFPNIWEAARAAWPVGTGLGTFELVFPAYRDPACGIYEVWDRAHNFFLEGMIVLGAAFWAALAATLAILVGVFLFGLRRRRRLRFAPALGLAMLLLLVAHDTLDFSLQIPGIALNAALLFAACCAISLRRRVAA
ncbi:ligase [Aureimonas endophytica]|uniref:Ligase n=1 Tax=Aureimonas endophytica TaxID=2027858 RepID=A0A916ZJH1_9HYPH|nr:O-antigen ligase family protein [Aureimonas endophytica]GGE00978.1 ligase [Aureimonas endophytica]